MKNVEGRKGTETPPNHVGLPSFAVYHTTQRERDSPSVPRFRSLSGSSPSIHHGSSQQSVPGGYTGTLPGSHLNSGPPSSSQGTQRRSGGNGNSSCKDNQVPHRGCPTGLHSMSIGNLLSSSVSATSSTLPTPTPITFLPASPPSVRGESGTLKGMGESRAGSGPGVTESGGSGERGALSNSFSWIPRRRSQSIATRGSSRHSCEVLAPRGVLPRSPSMITRTGAIPPLLDEPEMLGVNRLYSVPPSQRPSLFSHTGLPERHAGTFNSGPGDSFAVASTIEDEAAAMAEFEEEAQKIPEAELCSAVDNLLQKIRILQTEAIRDREVVQELSYGISQNFSDTEKRQEQTTNRIIRYLEKLYQKKIRLQKHLVSVQKNKQEQERNLAKVKKSIENLKEHLKSEEEVISQHIERKIQGMQRKRLDLEAALQKESYSLHQLEELVNEFQSLDASSAMGSAGLPDNPCDNVTLGTGLESGNACVTASSSACPLTGGGEGGSPSYSRKSSMPSVVNSQSSHVPAPPLESRLQHDTSLCSNTTPVPVFKKPTHESPPMPILEEYEKKRLQGCSSSTAEVHPGAPPPPLSVASSVDIGSRSRNSSEPGACIARGVVATTHRRSSSGIPRDESLTGSHGSASSITFSSPLRHGLGPSQSSPGTGVTSICPPQFSSNLMAATPNDSIQDLMVIEGKNDTSSQVASIRFLEKALGVLSHLQMDALNQQEYCRSQIQALSARVDEELRVKQEELDALQTIQRELNESTSRQQERSKMVPPEDGEDHHYFPSSSKSVLLPPTSQPMVKTMSHKSKEKDDSRDSANARGGRGRQTMGLSAGREVHRRHRGAGLGQGQSHSLLASEEEGLSHFGLSPSVPSQQGHLWLGGENITRLGHSACTEKNLCRMDEKGQFDVVSGAHHVTSTSRMSENGGAGPAGTISPIQVANPSIYGTSNLVDPSSEIRDPADHSRDDEGISLSSDSSARVKNKADVGTDQESVSCPSSGLEVIPSSPRTESLPEMLKKLTT